MSDLPPDVEAMLNKTLNGILVGRQVMRVGWREWCTWMQEHKYSSRGPDQPDLTRVGFDRVGAAEISTVFLGVDHSFGFGGPELWFETMVFSSGDDRPCWRYTTWDEAMAGHQRVVAAVREARALEEIS